MGFFVIACSLSRKLSKGIIAMNIKSVFTCAIAATALALTAGCQRSPVAHHTVQSNNNHSPACSSNPYLMRYGCSIKKVQIAAENGNADAQYALGYMYYYGIDTVQDRETGELWIQRSAAQGQPLAKKAWSLINSGAAFTDMHAAASKAASSSAGSPPAVGAADTIQQQESTDVERMNSAAPTAPITHYLPSYQQNTSQNTPSTVAPASQSSSASKPTAQNNTVKMASKSSTVSPASATSAEPRTVVALNDPRLSSNFQPVVASSAKGQQGQKDQKASSAHIVAKVNNTSSASKHTAVAMSDPRLSSSFQPVVGTMPEKQSA